MSSSSRPAPEPNPRRLGSGRWLGRIAGTAVVAILASACSISAQDVPVRVEPPAPATASPTASRLGVSLTVQAYFVRGDHLDRISRTVPPGAGLEPSLVALSMPLTRSEVSRGLRSALPVTGTALQGEVVDGVSRITMPAGFDRLAVRDQVLGMGQLVFTITANSLTTSVQLVRAGRPLAVPDGSGQLVTRPVGRRDYAGLAVTG